ncbi:NAD(P)H-binding protein [Candidatus Woesearchaeota archaeon]|nr:NAD(P)H-binding protein [Candidatus Woesearchaeota archaeon]
MANKRILVIGGSGYIGQDIVSRFVKSKFQVDILSRNPKNILGVRSIKGDVLNKYLLKSIIHDYEIIIYLAAIVRTIRKSRYKKNIRGLKNTITVLRNNGLKKIIYFSTQNIHIKNTGPYGNSKKECERLIKSSNLDYIIIRPNYVYKIDKKNDFYRLAKIMSNTMVCPLIGKGENKLQPVNSSDISNKVLDLVKSFKPHQIIDISGKTTTTLNEVADYIKSKTGKKAIKIHLPIRLLKLIKIIIPFDIDGYTDDRIAKDNPVKCNSDFWKDLNNILRL